MQQSLVAMGQLGFPLSSLLKTIQSRVQPKACYGAVFLLIRRDWAARLERLQDHWLRKALARHPDTAGRGTLTP